MSGTPETDAAVMAAGGDWSFPLRECSRRLERQRDEAVEKIKEWKTLCLWGGTPEHIHGFITGQQTRIWHLERERDEALAALMKIEDLFIDGENIYADREKMGCIAIEALKEAQ